MKLFTCSLLPIIAIVINGISVSNGADILVAMFMPAPSSHAKGMSAIAKALTRRGHNVTILNPYEGTQAFQTDNYVKAIEYKFINVPKFQTSAKVFEKGVVKQLNELAKDVATIFRSCQYFFDDSEVLTLLKESHFDMLIGDSFDGCDAMLSSYLGLPYIAVTTTVRYPLFHERLYGIPSPSSYVPFDFLPVSDKMSFFERIASFLEHHVFINLLEWTHFRVMDVIKNRHGIAPGRSLRDLMGGAELWLCMTSFALDYPHPTSPNWVAIGNIADTPAKPLEKV